MKIIDRPFLRFILSSGVAAVVNLLSRIALSQAMSYELAVAVAFPIGMTTAFVLARTFVFDPGERNISGQYVRFGLVNVAALAQVWVVSVGLARYVFPAIDFHWHAETIAHAIGIVSPVVTSYLGHKHFSFR